MRVRSGDAEIFYEVAGSGFPVFLLHPFTVSHEFWLPAAAYLSGQYGLILPDLRAHGRSQVGDGPATMAKHARDLMEVLHAESISRAVFCGVSISGYVLMEFWRTFRERVAALVLCNTRATPDSEEGRNQRFRSIEESRQHGPANFLDRQILNYIGESTRNSRPDLVRRARTMMNPMLAENIAAAQQGMATRPDSVATLKTIDVPTLLIAAAEDTLTPVADAELMRSQIPGSRTEVVPKAGHFAVFEQPETVGRAIRQFLDSLNLSG
jgi:pimeloyl-ACP methyl ester carboxylesterase